MEHIRFGNWWFEVGTLNLELWTRWFSRTRRDGWGSFDLKSYLAIMVIFWPHCLANPVVIGIKLSYKSMFIFCLARVGFKVRIHVWIPFFLTCLDAFSVSVMLPNHPLGSQKKEFQVVRKSLKLLLAVWFGYSTRFKWSDDSRSPWARIYPFNFCYLPRTARIIDITRHSRLGNIQVHTTLLPAFGLARRLVRSYGGRRHMDSCG
jgi:hypothetical protein